MKIPRLLMRAVPAFLCAALVALSGCGGSSDKPSAETTKKNPDTASGSTKTPDSGQSGNSTQVSVSGGARRPDEIWTDADGNKYLGSVPFDAFFDKPHEIATDQRSLGGTAVASIGTDSSNGAGMSSGGSPGPVTTDTEPESETSATDADATAAADGGGWGERMPLEVLDQEITSTRNFLNATLQSVGSYNSSLLMIEQKAASIAVLAQISMDHPEDVSWKEDAPYIRDLAKKMNESPLQRGKKDQVRLLKLFENMTDTFNRSRPADLEEPPADDGFSDVAMMPSVMKRMAEAEQKMKVEAGTESAFQSKKEMIQHEAAILGTFTHVICDENYGYGDDEEFTGYANAVIDAAKTIRNATEVDDFASYEVALSKISTNCQSCHSVFKNN